MTLKLWHLMLVGAVAVAAVAALGTMVLSGGKSSNTTKTVVVAVQQQPSSDASLAAAESSVRAALPDIEAYYADHNSYLGATSSALRQIDSGLSPTVSVVSSRSQSYCLQSTVQGQTASVNGPGGTIVAAPCS